MFLNQIPHAKSNFELKLETLIREQWLHRFQYTSNSVSVGKIL